MPKELDGLSVTWYPAEVPGTAASALRAAGVAGWSDRDYDAEDWWFRTTFAVESADAAHVLELDGLATLADVWVNGVHQFHGENMFTAERLVLGHLSPVNELAIRFAALAPRLAERRPRPRWRTGLVRHQTLRFVRTTLLGRMPGWSNTAAPVGPWRPVAVRARVEEAPTLLDRHLVARLDGDDGVVILEAVVDGARGQVAELQVGTSSAALEVLTDPDGRSTVTGRVRVPTVERWWPASHGDQPRYPVRLVVGEQTFDLGAVGFRTLEVDRSDGGFRVVVNGVPVFCRGALWVPPDVVSLAAGADAVRAAVARAADAHMNMLRVPGTMVYEDGAFFDACDELGVLVLVDAMLANFDYPEDEAFEASLGRELDQQFARLAGRPSVAVLCGGSEIEQQAAMAGVERGQWTGRLLEQLVPEAAAARLPDTPYVTSSPTGGPLPFGTEEGLTHYYGVGAYLRGFDDIRRSAVRFAGECLAFSVPPEPETVDAVFGGPALAGHHPTWKAAVPRDAGSSWDFEDVRDHYVARLFDVDVRTLRTEDPERYLDLGRAAVAECMAVAFAEWRRAGSPADGGLVLSLRDLVPGAGWGLVDALGHRKAPWFALRRLFAPLALSVTDEGLNGLSAHVANDRAQAWRGTLGVTLLADGATTVEAAEVAIEVAARTSVTVELATAFPSFRDLSYAYRFGPPAHDVVHVELRPEIPTEGDADSSEVVYFPLGQARAREHDLGLSAVARPGADGAWTLECATERVAQWVQVQTPGFEATDSWFHLTPGHPRRVGLRAVSDRDRPRGEVRALNARVAARIVVGEEQ